MRTRWAELVPPGLVFFCCAFVLALGAQFPDPRTWGFHQLSFLPRSFQLVASLSLLLLCLPSVAQHVAGLPSRVGRALDHTGFVLWSTALSTATFFLLKQEFTFLGDGIVWVQKLHTDGFVSHFEPLSAVIAKSVARLAEPQSPEKAAGLASVFSGALYVVGISLLCRKLWSHPLSRGLAWLLLLFHPTILFYFGYVESYPLLQTTQAFLMLCLVHSARCQGHWVLASVVLAVAMAMHWLAALWLPATLVARADGFHAARPLWRRAVWLLGLITLPSLLAIGITWVLGSGPLPLWAELRGSRGLPDLVSLDWILSRAHWVNVFNQLYLLFAPVMVLAVAAMSWRISKTRTSGTASTQLSSRVSAPVSSEWRAFSVMLGAALGFLLLVYPRIGGSRDWDLMSLASLPGIVLGVEFFRRAAASRLRNTSATVVRVAAGWSLGLTIVASVGFLAVQTNEGRAAERFTVLMDARGSYSTFARAYAHETLAVYYRGRDPRKERQAWLAATRAAPKNARFYNNLGNAELRLENYRGARQAFGKARELGMRDWFVLYNRAQAGLKLGLLNEIEAEYDALLQEYAVNWLALRGRARARLAGGRPSEALLDLNQALELAPEEDDLFFLRALALRALGRYAEARQSASRAVELSQHSGARQLLRALQAEAGPDSSPQPRTP